MGRVLEKVKEKSYNISVKLTTYLLIGALMLTSFGLFLAALRWVLKLLGVM